MIAIQFEKQGEDAPWWRCLDNNMVDELFRSTDIKWVDRGGQVLVY